MCTVINQWKNFLSIAVLLLMSVNLSAGTEGQAKAVPAVPMFQFTLNLSELWTQLVSFLDFNDRDDDRGKAVAFNPSFSVDGSPDDDDDPEG